MTLAFAVERVPYSVANAATQNTWTVEGSVGGTFRTAVEPIDNAFFSAAISDSHEESSNHSPLATTAATNCLAHTAYIATAATEVTGANFSRAGDSTTSTDFAFISNVNHTSFSINAVEGVRSISTNLAVWNSGALLAASFDVNATYTVLVAIPNHNYRLVQKFAASASQTFGFNYALSTVTLFTSLITSFVAQTVDISKTAPSHATQSVALSAGRQINACSVAWCTNFASLTSAVSIFGVDIVSESEESVAKFDATT